MIQLYTHTYTHLLFDETDRVVLYDLFIYVCGCAGSSLWHAGSQIFVAACGTFSHSWQILRCGLWDLVPCLGIKPAPPALGTQSLSHWTTGEVPHVVFKMEQNINVLKLLMKNSPLTPAVGRLSLADRWMGQQ